MDNHIGRWLGHIRALAADIGARGSATQAERRGLDYCAGELASLGRPVGEDRFRSAGSVFLPHLVAGAGIVLAWAIYRRSPWSAALLMILILGAEILELTLRPNPLHWVLPRRPSRNIYLAIRPSGPVTRDLVLMGHADTQRTPLIFSTPGWFAAYRLFSTAAFASFALMTALYVFGAASKQSWVWPVSTVGAVMGVLLAAICIEAELSPFTAGANDNASAVGLVLTLAAELSHRPLPGTRVWLVCSGCEEALHEGAKAFFVRHRSEMTRPRAIVLEMLGCSGPAWLESEGIVLPVRGDPELCQLAARVAAEHPELEAYPMKLSGGMTEASDAMAAGIPAITVIGLTRAGTGPYWHQPTDTVDKMDEAVMERNYRFVQALIEAAVRAG